MVDVTLSYYVRILPEVWHFLARNETNSKDFAQKHLQ